MREPVATECALSHTSRAHADGAHTDRRAHAPAILSHRSCVPAGYRRSALWRVSVSSRDHLRSLSFFFS